MIFKLPIITVARERVQTSIPQVDSIVSIDNWCIYDMHVNWI
jgi:hypothetical protein